jgi:hypothetical protein
MLAGDAETEGCLGAGVCLQWHTCSGFTQLLGDWVRWDCQGWIAPVFLLIYIQGSGCLMQELAKHQAGQLFVSEA